MVIGERRNMKEQEGEGSGEEVVFGVAELIKGSLYHIGSSWGNRLKKLKKSSGIKY